MFLPHCVEIRKQLVGIVFCTLRDSGIKLRPSGLTAVPSPADPFNWSSFDFLIIKMCAWEMHIC